VNAAARAVAERPPATAIEAAPARCTCGGLSGADGMCAKCRARRHALRRSPLGTLPANARLRATAPDVAPQELSP
jgi:hypothetical protein